MCKSSNHLVTKPTVRIETNTSDQKNTTLIADNEHKALAIGRSKLKQSQRVARWSRQFENYDEPSPKEHVHVTFISDEASDRPDDKLRAPYLDGGQGEPCDLNCTLVEPRWDVKAGASPPNNKSSEFPTEGSPMQPDGPSNATDSLSCLSSRKPQTEKRQPLHPNGQADEHGLRAGLLPPVIETTGAEVVGKDIERLRLQNKRRRHTLQEQQSQTSAWTTHTGDQKLPTATTLPITWRGDMCPSGIATSHPAGSLLHEWSQIGCPTRTGQPWTKEEMWEAVERGPHRSALSDEALTHFAGEALDKVNAGQSKIVLWDTIKDNPPTQLKISPIAAIPHKSRGYRSILDLSFSLKLKNGGIRPSVNDTTIKTAPKGALDQLGHALSRIIHAFAEADDTPDAKIFMAKWDVKDGFWRMMCEEGEEWNFTYVLPQPAGEPVKLVVPMSLQMGWVESPPYFCAASETARDISMEYANTKVGSLPTHKFTHYTQGDEEANLLPPEDTRHQDQGLRYGVEVYVDDFMSIVIPTSKAQLDHVATAIMTGIHDIFPANIVDSNDPISEKKMKKGEAQFSTLKTLLGFDFDGKRKTIWLEEEKRAKLLTTLKGWIRSSEHERGIPFTEFESITAKLRHAFTAVNGGKGLLSPCNRLLRKRPTVVYLHRNAPLLSAIKDMRTILRESTTRPTRCNELVAGWPDYVGICDASSFGAGGVIIGELSACRPTVFRVQWPPDITASVVSDTNKQGTLTNSDLEMAGLLLLWLMIKHVCSGLAEKRVALFSDNSPTVSWVQRMACRSSLIAEQLLRVLALRINTQRSCPLTTLHIAGDQNTMTDIPSRSFGSNPKWHFKTEHDLLTFFNSSFPLPNKNSWSVCQPTSKMTMRVISILRIVPFTLEDWRRLPAVAKNIGTGGKPIQGLWEWTHIFRTKPSLRECEHSRGSWHASAQDIMVKESKSKIAQSVARLQPLARRSHWPATTILPK